MNGKKAKALRRIAKHNATEKASHLELTNGKQKLLQINQDGSTEEVIKETKQIIRDDTKRNYKRLKKLYKELKQKGE